MDTEKMKRKLIALLSADVKGYSRLMSRDEEGTIRLLGAYKQFMADLIRQKGGRVVDDPGDNLLAEFISVVDAVQCALDIQKEIKVRNAELPEDRRMEFRIGINLGDVVEEGKRIFGDGVNIVARVEGFSEAGGVCLSGTAYDQVKNRLPLQFKPLGLQAIKNMAEPVRVYQVLMEPSDIALRKTSGILSKNKKIITLGLAAIMLATIAVVAIWKTTVPSIPPRIEAASLEKMAFPLPDVPSIAVLSLANLSDDPKLGYLTDGLAMDIINGLSRIEHIFVIASNSSFVYKGKPIKIKQVAEDLGVRYVLDGSLRKSDDRVRITVRLIDALTGRPLFSEQYDRNSKDFFSLLDEITLKVLIAVQARLTLGEDARIFNIKKAKNIDAYLKVVQAFALCQAGNKESTAQARRLTEEAIALDPDYAAGYAALVNVLMNETVSGVYPKPQEALEKALELGKKTVELDPTCSTGRALLTGAYLMLRRTDKALSEAEKLLSMAPNSSLAYFSLGAVLYQLARNQEAVSVLEKSLRLSPVPVNSGVLLLQGYAYANLGRLEEAVTAFRKGARLYPNHLHYRLGLAQAYFRLNRHKEAHSEIEEVLRINPRFALDTVLKTIPFQSRKGMEEFGETLRQLGLK